MTGILKSLLEDAVEEKSGRDLLATMKLQRKIVSLLENAGVAYPLKALYQIKRAIAQNKRITLTQIRQWGK